MFNKFIIEPFLKAAINFPQRNAFCIEDNYFTYAQFIQRIAAISKYLRNIDESKIALVTNNDIDTYASIFSIWITGKLYIPISPDTPEERNTGIIESVNSKIILNSDETVKLVSKDYETSIKWLQSNVINQDLGNDLAYIFFTSGSTGTPKGVIISKYNIASFVEAFWDMGYEINENDRCLQMFELTFDLSVMSYLIPLLKGACVYTIPKKKINYVYISELMDKKELTVALMVPSILNFMRRYFNEIYCKKMKYSLFCGEALHHNIIEEWANCIPNARIDNVYGPTENTIFCTSYTFNRNNKNDSLNDILSIGKPMLNNLTLVFDDNNKQLPCNEIGELCLAGNQLTSGYFNNSELNKKLFFMSNYNGINTQFYRTGDLCLLRENGNIDYIGRKDFQVKIQGFRIELPEIEYYCKKGIDHKVALVALAFKNPSANNEIAVVFESDNFNTKKLLQFLKSKLPSYMIPTRFHFLISFPLNINGKIDRKKIQKLIESK